MRLEYKVLTSYWHVLSVILSQAGERRLVDKEHGEKERINPWGNTPAKHCIIDTKKGKYMTSYDP